MAVAEELGVEHDTVLYLKEAPSRADLEHLVSILEDPVEHLVRRDSRFKKLELNPDDYVDNPEAVVDLLAGHNALIQRPVIIKGNRAIIGRPKSRVAEFLAS